jgi:hypothetical protein
MTVLVNSSSSELVSIGESYFMNAAKKWCLDSSSRFIAVPLVILARHRSVYVDTLQAHFFERCLGGYPQLFTECVGNAEFDGLLGLTDEMASFDVSCCGESFVLTRILNSN